MTPIDLIILLVIVLWLFGGYYGRGTGYYGVGSRPYFGGGVGLIILVLILLFYAGRFR